MFHFPAFASARYEFTYGSRPKARGFPIRTSPDLCLLAAPRGFSQLATSFFADDDQGIPHVPLVA